MIPRLLYTLSIDPSCQIAQSSAITVAIFPKISSEKRLKTQDKKISSNPRGCLPHACLKKMLLFVGCRHKKAPRKRCFFPPNASICCLRFLCENRRQAFKIPCRQGIFSYSTKQILYLSLTMSKESGKRTAFAEIVKADIANNRHKVSRAQRTGVTRRLFSVDAIGAMRNNRY